jgi:hypothetical protein
MFLKSDKRLQAKKNAGAFFKSCRKGSNNNVVLAFRKQLTLLQKFPCV